MPDEERTGRMRRMRTVVKEHNVYRWAENLISELAAIRLEPANGPVANLPLVKGAARHAEVGGMKIAG